MQNPHFIGLGEDEFIKEALNIVSKAKEKNIVLRIVGSLAIRLYAENNEIAKAIYKKRFEKPEQTFADLDLIGYRKQRGDIEKFFTGLQYQPDRMINRLFGDRRLIFYHPTGHFSLDIFFNKLEFSHNVMLGEKLGEGRLDLCFPSITPADTVLGKLQINQINKKDIIDLMTIFFLKEIGSDEYSINGPHVARTLSKDWGFWYDATNNLDKLRHIAGDMLRNNDISESTYSTILERVDKLLQIIEKEPKTDGWIKRSHTGTKKPWYTEVSDIS